MRTAVWSAVAACLVAGTAAAQVPGPLAAPPVLPAPAVVPEGPPPLEFGVGVPVEAPTVLPGVRPPLPVSGAPIEVPPGPMYWAEVDYLSWRAKGGLVPPLVVGIYTSAVPPLPPDPRMAFPVSDDRINGNVKAGYRLRTGLWIDKPNGTGFEAAYTSFLSSEDSDWFTGGPNTLLARPFVDAVARAPALFLLSDPRAGVQGVAATGTTFDSDGLELNMLRRGPAMFAQEFHWVIGLRYWSLEESLAIAGASQAGGLTIAGYDSFATRNRFYGPQFGGNMYWDRGKLRIELALRMALGLMTQETSIAGGSTAVLPSGAAFDRPGALLALSSNIGDHDRMKLAMVRDMSLNVGYRLTDHVQLRLGYQFLWASNVLRPGLQIDRGVNPTLLPFNPGPVTGPIRPWYRPDGEIFWMHGFTAGLAVQF